VRILLNTIPISIATGVEQMLAWPAYIFNYAYIVTSVKTKINLLRNHLIRFSGTKVIFLMMIGSFLKKDSPFDYQI